MFTFKPHTRNFIVLYPALLGGEFLAAMVSKYCQNMNDNPWELGEGGRATVKCLTNFAMQEDLRNGDYEWNNNLDTLTRDHISDNIYRFAGWGKNLIPVVLVTQKIDLWWEKRQHLLHHELIYKNDVTLDILRKKIDPRFNQRFMDNLLIDMQEYNTIPEILNYYYRMNTWEQENETEWDLYESGIDMSWILRKSTMLQDHKNHIKGHITEFMEKKFGPEQLTCADIFNEEYHLLNMDLVYRDRNVFAERCREIWPDLDTAGFAKEWEVWYARNR